MLNGYRKNDVVILVCQNNALKRIEIGRINASAEALLGFSSNELEGKSLTALLPQRIAEILQDHVEYGVAEFDVANVLSRVPNFKIVDAKSEEYACKLQVIPAQVLDGNAWFHLLLQPIAGKKDGELHWREQLSEQFKSHELLSEQTGFPSRTSLLKCIEQIQEYSVDAAQNACVALIEIANYGQVLDWHGPRAGLALHKEVGRICRQKLRGYDVVGSVSDAVLGIVMLDVKAETTRVVLNRLRWEMMANPVMVPKHGTVQLELRIAFSDVHQAKAEALLAKCEASLLQPEDSALSTSLIHQLSHAS